MGFWSARGRHCRELDRRRRAHTAAMAGWLVILAVGLAGGPSSASVRVHASILVDAQTGRILEAHNADRLCYPASLAKLMTLYITFQQLDHGKMTLHQELRVSPHAAAQPPVKMWLRSGEDISVETAILAITTRSANDAAVVLAESIAGTEGRFARLMNRNAARLGMNHTTFRNASGLPNRSQKTTARGMSKLALAILHDFPQYYHFFKARHFVFHGKTIYGHDHLLGRYPGVDGMKTGYTSASGYNLVTSAVQHNRRLVGVVMGGSSARSRDRLMAALLTRGFARHPENRLARVSRAQMNTDLALAKYVDVSDTDPSDTRPGWIVQVGGNLRSGRQARRILQSALNTAAEPLRNAKLLVVKLRGRRYRARFSNLSEGTARETCRLLRRRKFTCNTFQVHSIAIAAASAGR